MYDDYTDVDALDSETETLDGWAHLQELLASDEEWARYLYESFHGQEV